MEESVADPRVRGFRRVAGIDGHASRTGPIRGTDGVCRFHQWPRGTVRDFLRLNDESHRSDAGVAGRRDEWSDVRHPEPASMADGRSARGYLQREARTATGHAGH